MAQYSRQFKKPKRSYRALFIIIVIVLLIASGVTFFLVYHPKPKPTGSTGNSYTKGVTPSPQTQPSNTNNSSQQTGKAPGAASGTNNSSTTTDNTPLTAPWGTFVNVYNAKTTDQMGSTCNTTPGATCQINFTDGNITKSLSAQTTDAGGAAYWAWKPADIGLAPGVWHITATAILDSQTKTTNNDPLTLTLTQ